MRRRILTSLARRAADAPACPVWRAAASVDALVESTAADIVATSAGKNRTADVAAQGTAIRIQRTAVSVAVALTAAAAHAFAYDIPRRTADAFGSADVVPATAHAMTGKRRAAADILV